jgi:hypothetical protein
MLALAGTFEVLGFDEVLELLAQHRCTGRLRVRVGAHHVLIGMREGRFVSAAAANTTRREGGQRWRQLLVEVCCEALRNRRGSFELEAGREVHAASGPPLSVDDVLDAARREVEAWERVIRVIPTVEAVPRLVERPRPDPLTLDPERWRLIVAMDGHHSVASLARRLRLDPLRCCELLASLVETGVVALELPASHARGASERRSERTEGVAVPRRSGSNVRLLPMVGAGVASIDHPATCERAAPAPGEDLASSAGRAGSAESAVADAGVAVAGVVR